MSQQLSQQTVGSLDPAVAVPAYDRSALKVGIVHLGVGGFHRAHQAMYLDALMNEGKALDWAVCGVGVLPHDRRMIDTLRAQDGLYTLVLKNPGGHREARVIGSITEALLAPDSPERVLERMTDPAVRVVSLTITEGGYLVNQATGEFDADHPSIQEDLKPGAVPTTAFGYLTAALARRRAEGIPPFTVQSCDNIAGNGDVARRMITAFARLVDQDLADWMAAEVAFPNSMVDRITPVTASEDIDRLAEDFGVRDGWPVVCEPFTQWVIEDVFPGGRPPWEEVGAQLVTDVEPYELMKLRLLNASHQAIAYLGYLAGYRYAHDVCADRTFVAFVMDYMIHEGTPTLPDVPGVDLEAYREELIARFANPEIRDTLARLAAMSSDRIPKWLVPVINHNLENDGDIRRSALVVASWARYATGRDERDEPIEVVDRLKTEVMRAAAKQTEDPIAFLRNPDLFGPLADNDRFTTAYTAALHSLYDRGAAETVARITNR